MEKSFEIVLDKLPLLVLVKVAVIANPVVQH
jgi:hypothetical protein